MKPDAHGAKSGLARAYMGLGRTEDAEKAARELIAAITSP
jgi:Flp pilus assembly protein TadD